MRAALWEFVFFSEKMAARMDVFTQCSFDLLNRPKFVHKAVTCNIKPPDKSKKISRTIGVQCEQIKSPMTVNHEVQPNHRPSTDSLASEGVRQKLALKVRAGLNKTSTAVQCSPERNSRGTQYDHKHINGRVTCSKSVQVDEHKLMKVERNTRSTQCGGLPDSSKGTCLESAVYILNSTQEFHSLQHKIETRRDNQYVVITRSGSFGDTGEPVDPVSVSLDRKGCLSWQVLYKQTEKYQLVDDMIFDVGQFCDYMRKLANPCNTFCSGIKASSVVESNKGHIRVLEHPYLRYQSKKCQVMYVRDGQERSDSGKVTFQCLNCKYATKYLAQVKRRQKYLTPSKKLKRILVHSNYAINRLTPSSKRKRLLKSKQRRKSLNQRVKRLEKKISESDVYLNKQQSTELRDIVNAINKNHKDDLEAVLNTANTENVKKTITECWERDSQERHVHDIEDFYQDQLNNENGDRGNKWSPITYRIALAVYSRSTAAYLALKNFNILNLPGIRSLQKKSKQYLDKAGINKEYLKAQSKLYADLQEEKQKRGEPVPNSVGVLIFDEVKVIDKVAWNSKNHEFVGLAMSCEDFPYLYDIFSEVAANGDAPRPANYILQFLWRDLSSSFDVMGPYFMCFGSLEHKFILGCLLETIRNFESMDFEVKCIMCDGASENLALIKNTMGRKGVFGYCRDLDGGKNFTITPSFTNPFRPESKIHWIICPSHQMKNMISALHSSRETGPKNFIRNGVSFGWEEVRKVKQRDNERFENGQIRYARHLLQSYIERDAWTRLNVKPSKILQQEDVLSELFDHANTQNNDAANAHECYRYLRAVNLIFEQGFFSKKPVRGIGSEEVKNIEKGYKYFEDWLKAIFQEDPGFNPNKPTQSKFISWQTWDLLRVCIFGVKELVQDFCSNFPLHYLTLSRINGSAVETLFSQFKFATGSKLSSTNYATARMAVITKTNVHGRKFINRDYRDVPLYIRDHNI